MALLLTGGCGKGELGCYKPRGKTVELPPPLLAVFSRVPGGESFEGAQHRKRARGGVQYVHLYGPRNTRHDRAEGAGSRRAFHAQEDRRSRVRESGDRSRGGGSDVASAAREGVATGLGNNDVPSCGLSRVLGSFHGILGTNLRRTTCLAPAYTTRTRSADTVDCPVN